MLHDGWSFNLFLYELFTLYKGYAQGTGSVLPEAPIQFADFACWQRQWMTGKEAANQLNFWTRKLAGSPRLLVLPSDRPRPVAPTFKGAVCRVELPLKLCAALRAGSREQKVTLFMSMFSAFAILLYRLSGNKDFCVGSGIANRRWKETESLLGMLVNNIVLRVDLSGNPSVHQVLRKVKELTLEAYANQDVPFDKVVEALHPVRELSHNPLFQVMFSFHDSPLSDFDLPGSKVTVTETISNRSAKWDINIIVIPRAEQKLGNSKNESTQGITIVWEYTTDLFDAETMQRWVAFYQNILAAMLADPEQRIDDLPLLSSEERELLLEERATEKREYPREASVAELLEEQVKQRPEATAVVYEGKRLSYEQLNRRANRLARSLREKGVRAEGRVGICVERSLEMVIGIVGIVKAGGAYVPMEAGYPEERKQWMARDTGMKWMVVEEGRGQELELARSGVELVEVARVEGEEGEEWRENPRAVVGAENLAYVMYTSGSTGKPKGVGVTHRGVVRLVKGANYVELGAEEKMLQLGRLEHSLRRDRRRYGQFAGGLSHGNCFRLKLSTLFVLPIGIFGMFQVPQGSTTVDGRHFFEVVRRWRRGGHPFQRPGIPRVVASRFAFPQRSNKVVDKDRVTGHLNECAKRGELVPNLPPVARIVRVNPAWHSEHARNVHGTKRKNESDVQQPELPAGEPLRQHSARHFWVPIMDASERAKERAADQHPMEVPHHEVAVRKLEIERRGAEHNPGQAANEEHRQKAK